MPIVTIWQIWERRAKWLFGRDNKILASFPHLIVDHRQREGLASQNHMIGCLYSFHFNLERKLMTNCLFTWKLSLHTKDTLFRKFSQIANNWRNFFERKKKFYFINFSFEKNFFFAIYEFKNSNFVELKNEICF